MQRIRVSELLYLIPLIPRLREHEKKKERKKKKKKAERLEEPEVIDDKKTISLRYITTAKPRDSQL